MRNKIARAGRLADRAPIPLETESGKTTFTMRRMRHPMATVVVVEFKGDKVQK
jgi:hypothetical protein